MHYETVVVTISLFCFSKIPELFDTVFLAVRKREIILLHWYHHVTVLLFVWWMGHHNVGSAGCIFAGMNLFVHWIMYGYYALGSIGVRLPFPIVITILQILQMIVGTLVVLLTIRCSDHMSTTVAGLVMYASYAVLFTLFFVQRYLSKPKRGVDHDPRISKDKIY